MIGQYDFVDGSQQNYFTWDQLLKVIPKLPDIVVFLQKDQIRNTKFFEENEHRYSPPFYIFSKKTQVTSNSKYLTYANCNEFENIPHTNELLNLFQQFLFLSMIFYYFFNESINWIEIMILYFQ